MVSCGAHMMEWVFVPSQFDGLADGTECSLDATNLDLVTSFKFAFLDPSSESMQGQQSFCWS